MRNLTDEQVVELAYGIVSDHLREGIDYMGITEMVDNEVWDDDDQPTDEDYDSVHKRVEEILKGLVEQLELQ